MNTRRRQLTFFVGVSLTLLWATQGVAQGRLTIPSGTVLELRTEGALNSDTSRVGDVFTNTVTKSVYLDGTCSGKQHRAGARDECHACAAL